MTSIESVSAVAGLRSPPAATPMSSSSHVPSFGETRLMRIRPLPGSGVSGASVAGPPSVAPKDMTNFAVFSSATSAVVTRKFAVTVTCGRFASLIAERSAEKSRNLILTPSALLLSPFLSAIVEPSMRAGWPGS